MKTLGICVAVLLAAAAPGEEVIRSATRLVEVNVVVHDKNGPVRDLSKDDFVLSDRGKVQAIGVFAIEARVQAAEMKKPLAVNLFSNRAGTDAPAAGGVTIILLDSLNTMFAGEVQYSSSATNENGALAFAKQQALKFAKDLDPHERVAVYSLGRSLRVLCDFTGDREQLLKVIGAYHDTSLTKQEDAEPEPFHSPAELEFNAAVDQERRNLANIANASRAEVTIAALRAIAARVADIPGRKNLVWLTADLPIAGGVAARVLHDSNLALYPVDARGLTASFNPHYQPKGFAALLDLAEQTGGRAFFNTNDLSGAIRAAQEDAAVSYTLGFYPPADSLDGGFHELKVHVKRAGVDVRYRRGYFAFRDAPAGDKKSGFTRALESPLEASGIGLAARLEQVKQPGPAWLRLWCSIDLARVRLTQVGELRKGTVEIYTVQQNESGSLLEKTRKKLDLSLTPEQYHEYLKTGVVFGERIEPKAGFNTLRVIVGDSSSGATGTLIIPVAQIH